MEIISLLSSFAIWVFTKPEKASIKSNQRVFFLALSVLALIAKIKKKKLVFFSFYDINNGYRVIDSENIMLGDWIIKQLRLNYFIKILQQNPCCLIYIPPSYWIYIFFRSYVSFPSLQKKFHLFLNFETKLVFSHHAKTFIRSKLFVIFVINICISFNPFVDLNFVEFVSFYNLIFVQNQMIATTISLSGGSSTNLYFFAHVFG